MDRVRRIEHQLFPNQTHQPHNKSVLDEDSVALQVNAYSAGNQILPSRCSNTSYSGENEANKAHPEFISETCSSFNLTTISDSQILSVFQKHTATVQKYFALNRFRGVKRQYTAADVAKMAIPNTKRTMAHDMSVRLWNSLLKLQCDNRPLIALDALDPLQAVVAAPAAGAHAIYVSGWQTAAMGLYDEPPGPDLADLPHDYVAKSVHRITRSQEYHANRLYESRMRHLLLKESLLKGSDEADQKGPERVAHEAVKHGSNQSHIHNHNQDPMIPVIADGDSGHGGMTTVMRMVRGLIEAGAGAVHFEDQKVGSKLGGPIAGAVLCSPREFISRLVAARLQADISLCPLVLIARTDAMNASYVESNVDPMDHMFILGTTNPMITSLADTLAQAQRKRNGKHLTPSMIAKLHASWEKRAQPCTYPEAVERALLSSNIPFRSNYLEIWRFAMRDYFSSPSQHSSKAMIAPSNSIFLRKFLQKHSTNGKLASICSLKDARELAKKLGVDPHWDWEKPRSPDGLYRIQGGELLAAQRAKRYFSFSDVIWLGSTGVVAMSDATSFADKVESFVKSNGSKKPLMLACAFSAPRGWSQCGLKDCELSLLSSNLASKHFTLQLVPASGFHAAVRGAGRLAAGLGTSGIGGYVKSVWPENGSYPDANASDLKTQGLQQIPDTEAESQLILDNIQERTAAQNGWTGATLAHSLATLVRSGEVDSQALFDQNLPPIQDQQDSVHMKEDFRKRLTPGVPNNSHTEANGVEKEREAQSIRRWIEHRQAKQSNARSPAGDSNMGSEEVYAEAFE